MPDPDFAAQLARAIRDSGPVPVAHFMAAANLHYYATRDPLGVRGDFTTAPEVSQMFGELVGLWLADLWIRMERPLVAYVELGPGRGTLARDALRAMAATGLRPPVHFVETSPVLRAAQAAAVPGATFHANIESLPADLPLLITANEFFDALPVHQIMRHDGQWHQRLVGVNGDAFVPLIGAVVPEDIIPLHVRSAAAGEIIETSPASVGVMRMLAQRVAKSGGVGLVIDYGYDGPACGDTLQAVKAHCFTDPFASPGEQDLTAHVDFATLGAAAATAGTQLFGPVGQGLWLSRLGLAQRAAALSTAHPDRAAHFAIARDRLAGIDQMGALFRVMSFGARGWPRPEGFGGQRQ